MTVREFLGLLGDEIEDVDEEIFLLYAQPIPSANLGFVDPKAASLSVSVGGREYELEQAPDVLGSVRKGGTTGAVLWSVTPLLAEWLSRPTNPLLASLPPTSCVLELGCGTSGLLALVAGPRVARYTLTDQPYVLRTLAANLAANAAPAVRRSGGGGGGRQQKKRRGPAGRRAAGDVGAGGDGNGNGDGDGNVSFVALDWERDVPDRSLTGDASLDSFDLVLACDCVYNEALVRPFVQTCAEACALRAPSTPSSPYSSPYSSSPPPSSSSYSSADASPGPTVCVVALQLRDPDVFTAWIEAFHERFRTWRVPDGVVGEGLGSGSGFVVYVGVLRG